MARPLTGAKKGRGRRLALAALATLACASIASPPEAVEAKKAKKQAKKRDCGPRIPKGNGAYWRCTFADSFRGKRLNRRKWVPQRTDLSGYTIGPTACFVDSPNNIKVSKGTLKLRARMEPVPFICKNPLDGDFPTRYTSGMVSTAEGRFSQAYGRFEIRAKVLAAPVPGLQTALWLWPDNSRKYGPRPASGEIDIAEMFSQYPDRAIPYIHYIPFANGLNVTKTSCTISNLRRFHTYAVEWTKRRIKVIYDDKKCLVHRWRPAPPLSRPEPFDHPFFVALTQGLGVGTNAFNPATTPLPATTKVDYVRVWK